MDKNTEIMLNLLMSHFQTVMGQKIQHVNAKLVQFPASAYFKAKADALVDIELEMKQFVKEFPMFVDETFERLKAQESAGENTPVEETPVAVEENVDVIAE